MDTRRVAILGAGTIGESLLRGLLSGGWREPGEIVATVRDEVRARELEERHGVQVTLSNTEAVAGAALVVIAVKPQDFETLLGEIGGVLTPEQTVLSVAAAIALRKRWDYLFLLAALGTVAIESLWVPIHDAQQMRFGFPICLGLQGEFLLFAWLRQRIEPNEKWSTPAAALVAFASIGYVFILLSVPSLAMRPGFFLGFAFLADIGLLFLATMRPNPARIAGPAATAVFALLAVWTAKYLEHDLLWWGLGAYIIFALIHSGFTVWPKRPETVKPASTIWQGFIPLLALVLLFICV